MEWSRRLIVPMRRIWTGVARRVGIRRTGLTKLRNDVRTSEYGDVHVLWEMLEKNEREFAGPRRSKRRHFWNICDWARPPYPSRGF